MMTNLEGPQKTFLTLTKLTIMDLMMANKCKGI